MPISHVSVYTSIIAYACTTPENGPQQKSLYVLNFQEIRSLPISINKIDIVLQPNSFVAFLWPGSGFITYYYQKMRLLTFLPAPALSTWSGIVLPPSLSRWITRKIQLSAPL